MDFKTDADFKDKNHAILKYSNSFNKLIISDFMQIKGSAHRT